MKDQSDVIIAGGGPCGSFTAFNLAKKGVNVTVFEEHAQIGIPSHCPGHLSINGLKMLGLYPLPSGIVENVFCGATFYSPSCREFSVRFSKPITCTVNRTLFDKHLAEKAELAGAHYSFNSRVESPILKQSFVTGVTVNREGMRQKEFGKIIIDAEGISPKLSREVGLPRPDRNKLVKGVEAEVQNVTDVMNDTVEVFLGRDYAPGFYAWLIPKKDGKAKIGLATKAGDPKGLLQKLMLKHPIASKKLRSAKIKEISFHPITLGGHLPYTYANGLLAVGDAASQVKPTTGGGIIFGLTCAQVASQVVYESIKKDDFSSRSLEIYQKRCEGALGFDTKIMLRIRKTLDSMSDKRIDNIVALCSKLGMDKTLQEVKDIDFQGRTLLNVLRSPKVLMTLVHFFFAYLSANP